VISVLVRGLKNNRTIAAGSSPSNIELSLDLVIVHLTVLMPMIMIPSLVHYSYYTTLHISLRYTTWLCKQLCDAGIYFFTPASIMCHFRITSSLLYMFDSSLSCELPLSLCYCSSSVTLTRLGIWSLYYRVGLAGELSSNVFIFIICQFFVGLSYHYTTVTWYVSIMLMPSMALFFIWQWRSLLIIPYRSWVVTNGL